MCDGFPLHHERLCVCTADIDASVGFLMQIDKLVQLLESPIFIHMRLQLLEIHEEYHANLVKSLYGLLMLLPQSAAFRMLRDRLVSVTNMATAIGRIDLGGGGSRALQSSSNDAASSAALKVDTVALLAHFDAVQSKHTEIRKKGANERDVDRGSWKVTLTGSCVLCGGDSHGRKVTAERARRSVNVPAIDM